MKGTVTLGNTYTVSLKQSGSLFFWILSTLIDYKVFGADATNTFAEAPPPVAPLYVTIYKSYRS